LVKCVHFVFQDATFFCQIGKRSTVIAGYLKLMIKKLLGVLVVITLQFVHTKSFAQLNYVFSANTIPTFTYNPSPTIIMEQMLMKPYLLPLILALLLFIKEYRTHNLKFRVTVGQALI
jgi:hypothetical protein